ncbi:MAG: transcriptional regulator, AraC family [Caulobacter sp.]|nr:transcriptional regulator, AraC family [Caulobacter sp.]
MTSIRALVDLIERYAPVDGIHEGGCPRVALVRASQPSLPHHGVLEPALCVLAQGRKQVLIGDAIHVYDASRYLLASVDVPVVGQVIEASPTVPYLGFRLTLDPALIAQVALDCGVGMSASEEPAAIAGGMAVAAMTSALLDAVTRMVRLLDTPRDVAALAPLIEREIVYRLLTDVHGPRLAQIARVDGRLRQVNRAIGWIKRNYDQPFRMDQVAAEARMSASALHQHFKAVTALSPLQYQKQLRLQEARRLILMQHLDAASAGHAVGYDSPSQFSREYARLFGAPPLRDAVRLRSQPDLVLEA